MEARDVHDNGGTAVRGVDSDDVQGVMTGAFYNRVNGALAEEVVPPPPMSDLSVRDSGKPTHYKVICISMYTRDLKRLDGLVDELKGRGMTKANRSALIRAALDQLDLDKVQRGI